MVDIKRGLTLGIVALAFGFGLHKAWIQPSPTYGFRLPVVDPAALVKDQKTLHRRTRHHRLGRNEEPIVITGRFESHFASSRLHVQTHAASLVELDNNDIRAFWFSGSREGAPDVTIDSAVYDPATRLWGPEQVVASRAGTQRALHRFIGKLGNPVVGRAADGSLRLFYVTVSLGGWGGSSITMMTSHDDGETWGAPRRLITSPFVNISTLVKGTPFLYADGTMGLPVYHESFGKFAEILRLDGAGRVIDKQRLASAGEGTLQPVVMIKSPSDALVLTRYAGKDHPHLARRMTTRDGGRSWGPVRKSSFPNPDAALSGVALPDGRLLAVLNHQEHGRDSLSLMSSADGGLNWRELHRLEEMRVVHDKKLNRKQCMHIVRGLLLNSDRRLAKVTPGMLGEYLESTEAKVREHGGCNFEFSYPYMIQARNGDIHIAYTWNRVFIKHVTFDTKWLNHHFRERNNAGH